MILTIPYDADIPAWDIPTILMVSVLILLLLMLLYGLLRKQKEENAKQESETQRVITLAEENAARKILSLAKESKDKVEIIAKLEAMLEKEKTKGVS